ncbi:MAG: holo-ACP synthase [Solobacterium sp.]|nr:holo-ACP synthase [Solobacterium sp.]
MIHGVGTDLVYIPRLQKMLDEKKFAFFRHVFSEYEREHGSSAQYFAARFAVKEAVFKAVHASFDFRIIETMNLEDGKPVIRETEAVRKLFDDNGIDRVEISIAHEQDYASAFAVAIRKEKGRNE